MMILAMSQAVFRCGFNAVYKIHLKDKPSLNGAKPKIGWVGVRQGDLTSRLKLLTVRVTDCGARFFTSSENMERGFPGNG